MTTDPAPEVATGEPLLPGYLAVARLTHGHRLDTWDAYDLDRGTRCIVKILRPDRVHEKEVAAAVVREGEILTGLAHPHLVRGFEVIRSPRPAVVMETLRGSTVGALLDEGPLSMQDVAVLGLQVTSVLGYLHRHGWLHLDLKPENVIADHGRAVLIDLSLACHPGDGRPGAGTTGYMAPEQATGRDLSTATDVYGLAATLWDCLSGEPPRGAEHSWGTSEDAGPGGPRRRPNWFSRRREGGAPGADARAAQDRIGIPLPPDVPDDVAAVLLAAVALDPAARPRLDEVAEVLLRHTGTERMGPPVPARPASLTPG